ncbi:rhamnogalacturonan lyase [Kocuria rosea]|uniref:rhamnogalacturonan lyase n=1 Tax=Kocuria rosea TaxID=1275 RepID=UPI00203A42D4|nr:rhamnogalacturonan lyase [Kocuria rosea]MCM3689405.1 rhamnogalacturonan lyase [Kocuria rosea]
MLIPPAKNRRIPLIAGGSIAALLLLGLPATAHGAPTAPAQTDTSSRPQLEHLDRGLVAVPTTEGIFLSWRLLGHEATGHSEEGMTGPDFRVYRDDALVATVTDSTNYLDNSGDADAGYRVVAVVDGVEVDVSAQVRPWEKAYGEIPLQRPADGLTPTGETYTYAANDMSVGDVDGDGQYEYVVKWDPSNSKDVSQKGYTGNVYIDTYEADGTLLHRIDLGVNVRAGAHYTQFLVNDFDGDGRSEVMLKTAPGTRTTTYADGEPVGEQFITLPAGDVAAGHSHDDDYRMSAADYEEHLVQMFLGWHEHPEVVAGRWPATLEEAFGIEARYDYPLGRADAEALVDHFIDVYAPARSARNDLRTFEGFILTGPEYLTVFDGATGRELQTVHYEPGRSDDGLRWGDYALARIEPGNRVDRFLAGVAYLDGRRPTAIFARGYYTRSAIVAYDWDGEQLSQRWTVDSGWTPMDNPFNAAPHGTPGTDPEFGSIASQGFHSLSAADVDGDGKHEVVYGSATIDHDGSLLYSSSGLLPAGSKAPGTSAGFGHGDAMHVTDIDPDRPGLEIFTVHENGTSAPYGMAMRQAEDGKLLFGTYSGRDTGRGMIGDVVPESRGVESWANMPGGSGALGVHSATGEHLLDTVPGTNQSIRWAADMTTQIVNGSGDQDVTIDDWQHGRLLTAAGTRTNNGTKGNPSLVADVQGDWREELLVRTADSSAIRIYLSTEVTDRRLHTLMHDPQYRAEVARQQTSYNQPSYTGFYLASDIDWSKVPVPDYWAPGALPALDRVLQDYISDGAVAGPIANQLTNTLATAQHHLDANRPTEAAEALERFQRHLEAPKKPDALTPSAAEVLRHQASTIVAMLS